MKPVAADEPNLVAALPHPGGLPVPCFFGRRFLTARELIATGLVRNHVTLRRLIAEERFPPPLQIGRKLRVWDCLELQALIDRLAAARGGKGPAATATAGSECSENNTAAVVAADIEPSNAPSG
jgi:predicted DNA-binding transcriptional regulator AlpA